MPTWSSTFPVINMTHPHHRSRASSGGLSVGRYRGGFGANLSKYEKTLRVGTGVSPSLLRYER
jgi:hypothetical protein